MGFDIYGRKPKITTEKPAAIDYKTATDDEKKKYWPAILKWEIFSLVVFFHTTCVCLVVVGYYHDVVAVQNLLAH